MRRIYRLLSIAALVVITFVVCQAATAATLYDTAVASISDLQAYWMFNDASTVSGQTAADSSGKGNNGSYYAESGCVITKTTSDTPGVGATSALYFDGSNCRIGSIAETGFASGSADRSVVFWMKAAQNTTGGEEWICQFGQTGTFYGSFIAGFNTSSQLFGSQWGGNVNAGSGVLNAWHMITLTVSNGATYNDGTADWSIYVDNSSTAAGTSHMNTNTVLTGNGLIAWDDWFKPYKGYLADMAYYTKALSSQERQSLYSAMTIPEPCSLTMTTLGLLSLLAYAWRKRK